MRKNFKKVLLLTLVLLIAISMFVINASAAETNDYVAEVGGVKYETLAKAITNATSGQTITLIADVDENVTISKSLTIDGGGKNYTGTMTAGKSLTVTVQNVNFVNGGFSKSTRSNDGTYRIKNCTFDGNKRTYNYAITIVGAATVTVEDCTVKDYSYGFLYVSSSLTNHSVKNVTVENCNYGVRMSSTNNTNLDTFITKNVKWPVQIQANAARTVNMTNCLFEGSTAAVGYYGGTSNVTFNLNKLNDIGTEWPEDKNLKCNAEAQNGTKFGDLAAIATDAKSGETVTLLKDYTGEAITLPEGVKLDDNDKAGADKITVVEPTYVAQIGEVKYASLQEAIDAAANGATIELISDIVFNDVNDIKFRNANSNGNGAFSGFNYGNGAFVNVIGGNMTIDLNGHTITYDLHDIAWCNKRVVSIFYVTDKANLTIKDTVGTGAVTVYGMATAIYSVAADTKVTVEGGTWTWNPCKTCGATNAFLYASHGGELYIAGGKFVNNVKGEAGDYMIFSHYSSKETTENSAGIDFDSTKIGITGGSFHGYNPGKIKYMDQGDGNKEIVDSGCAEGFAPVDNGNGEYSIVKTTVAIGEETYASLAEALAAAKAGDTITFLADVNENVTISKNLIIDGAGFKYTGTMTVNAGLNVTVNNVNFVNGGFAKSAKGATGNYTITNCKFDGKGAYAYPLLFKGAHTITVEGCTVKNYVYSFLYVTSSAINVSVKDVTVENCPNYAVYFASGVKNAKFEDFTVKNSNSGFIINNTANRAFTIKNCTMENVVTAISESKGTNAITCTVLGTNNNFGNATLSDYATIVLAEQTATLKASEDANVTTNVTGFEAFYKKGIHYVAVPVAAIGDVKYETLQAAIEAAQNGETVVLLKDFVLTEADCVAGADRKVLVDVVGKDITLDMNGKKISVVHEDAFTNDYIVAVIRVADGAGLTIKGNGTIDVKVREENPDMAYMFWKQGTTGHLTIENGTFHMNDSADSMVYTNGNEIVNIEGGTWTLDAYGTRGNREPWIFNVKGSGDKCVIVTGGTFNADINRQFWSNEVVVPETHYTVENTDGTWTVYEGAVAYVNEGMLTGPYFVRKNIGYATFEEALKAADEGETIKLLKNLALTETLNVEKPVTIDANGFSINGDIIVLANVDAIVKGGEGFNVTSGVADYEVVYANGKYSLVKCDYVAQVGNKKFTSLQAAIEAAQNGETVVLLQNIDLAKTELGQLDGSYDTYFLVKGKSITVNLNGKTISGAYAGEMLVGVFSTDDKGHLTLTGNGTVDVTATGKVYCLIANYEEGCSITIENGTYKLDKASDSLIYSGANYGENQGVLVKAGNFTLGNVGTGSNGKPWIFNVKGSGEQHVIVIGGTFNADVYNQHWIWEVQYPYNEEPVYAIKNNGDGTWTVVLAEAYIVRNIDGYDREIGFATFEEALKAADEGETIKLLEDLALTETLTVEKPVTIDANGFSINGDIIVLANADATVMGNEGFNVTTNIDYHVVVYADGVYKAIDTRFEIDMTNTRFGSDFSLLFAFNQEKVEGLEGLYAIITHGTDKIKYDFAYWKTLTNNGKDYFVIEYAGIVAKQMGDAITIEIFDANGNIISVAKTTSIRDYALNRLKKTNNAAFKTALVDMLNYGAAAQLQFIEGITQDKLVNRDLGEYAELASTTIDKIQGEITERTINVQPKFQSSVEFVGSNLRFDNKTNMLIAVNVPDPEQSYAVFVWTDHYRNEHSVKTEFTYVDKKWCVELDQLVIADARQVVECHIYNANDELMMTVIDAVVFNVQRELAGESTGYEKLYKAYMLFADSAYAYLHS